MTASILIATCALSALAPQPVFVGAAKPVAFHKSYAMLGHITSMDSIRLPKPGKPTLEILPLQIAKVTTLMRNDEVMTAFLETHPHYLPFRKDTFGVLINSDRENPYAEGLRRELDINAFWRLQAAVEWFNVLDPSGWLITRAADYFEKALLRAGFYKIPILIDDKKVFVKRMEGEAMAPRPAFFANESSRQPFLRVYRNGADLLAIHKRFKPIVEVMDQNRMLVFNLPDDSYAGLLGDCILPPFLDETFSMVINSMEKVEGVAVLIFCAMTWHDILIPSGWLLTNADRHFEQILLSIGFAKQKMRVNGKMVFIKKPATAA
jgi:hypothetical protein